MKDTKKFTMEQLSNFLHQYPIQALSNRGYYNPNDETGVYLVAFKYLIENEVDIMEEYVKIKKIFLSLDGTEMYLRDGMLHHIPISSFLSTVADLKFILNYNGPWNIESFFKSFNVDRSIIENLLNEFENGFPNSHEKAGEKREEDHNDYVESYYKAKRTLNKKDMDNFFNNELLNSISNKIDKNTINLKGIKYPLLVLLYRDNKIISIHKVPTSLESSLINYKKTKKFDSYSYTYIDENFINDIMAEAIVRYNPSNLFSNAIAINNSIYRTLNQVKLRYKGENGIDLRVIKRIIDIYEIPVYNLSNGSTVIDKDLFDEAVIKYTKGK